MADMNLRVLVVDDEPAIRRFLRVSLGAHGYTVFEASNGQEALAGVAAHRPDLVILDLGLPDIDGLEVTRQLREWTHLPIIIRRCAARKLKRLLRWTRAPTIT
jgi:two-component system KDP operon response regulator KdpE